MDFIERWLGMSPDGGSGLLETLIVFVLVVAVARYIQKRGHDRT